MRILVVNNPRTGLVDAGLFDFVNMLGAGGAEVVIRYLTEGRDVRRALTDADRFDRVVAAGGDGTVSSIAHELRDSGVPILAYPAGTANLIALNLGLPSNARALADTTVDGVTADVDVGELRYTPRSGERGEDARTIGFVMAAGAGFDARVIEGAQDLKASIGPAAYLVGALRNLAPTVARFTLLLDGETVETEGIAVMLTNFAKIQFDIAVTRQTDVQDGLVDVVVLATRNVPELLPALWAGLLDRVVDLPGRPGLEVHSASEVEIVADPPLPLQADGEVLDAITPAKARMLRRAARFVVPEGTSLEAR